MSRDVCEVFKRLYATGMGTDLCYVTTSRLTGVPIKVTKKTLRESQEIKELIHERVLGARKQAERWK